MGSDNGSGSPLSGIMNTGMGFVDNVTGLNIGGQNANQQAAQVQQQGANNANQALQAGFNNQQNILQPYQQAGNQALTTLSNGFGMNGQQVLNADPGYQFRLDQGNQAINAAAAARGLGNSGAALKELTRYGQDYASNEYNNAYNRQYNTLSQLAGYGNQASTNLAGAQGTMAQGFANNDMGAANAQAGADVARGNQQGGFLSQVGGMAASKIMASDARLKTDIRTVDKADLIEMKKHLKAIYYKYISNEFGEGEHIGIMAQDLEKSKLGRTLVVHDARGNKMIDMNRVLSMWLATMAEAA